MVLPTPENPRIIALFDVDGTLTIPRGEVKEDMMEVLKTLRKKITVGIVGGSDLPKQEEQLGDGIVDEVVWNFSQNGLVAYENGKLLESNSVAKHLGEDNIKRIVNWVMRYFADLELPIKRGTFIEFRSGMLNISPIGRNCSREERNDYEKFDLEHNIRKTMVAAMKEEFSDLDMTYSIGGQISFDVFPTGWDKTYCLQYLKESDFDEIHFFGDKTFEGGNDFEIFSSQRTIGHTVTSPEDTIAQLKELFLK
jgi:phosphomannomutase|mmetsp:Transcript_4231/g.9215  ORF Transcript_4231/g.9215 Transcript_4231/m.9215 type:complete len:252 (+) Transcript_4231:62-817(+)|eukprot:CAMPEP_0201264722 /NCGR_PEP_ID=MMETSP0853-20130426/8787_1 /ASSEMBLY_ACC=CAM_ASM_000640 /TAXON_ID=183588 /ORGANISM="Pseudo-nitzschia fraudulenta, Strain WWA7" /LENGTH=251 /DNA_ID=CAMNT_0047568679 /DNA_START=65 /DNA_END=820 /DNA_ORIENTATION=+